MRDERKEKKNVDQQIPLHSAALRPHPTSRVFCAVELPSELRARAVEHIARLRDAVPYACVGWERIEKLHITLKFLGKIASNQIESLSDAASRAAQRMRTFNLALEGAGAFPTRGVPRIIWLGINDSQGLLSGLQSQLEEECESLGFAREERPFHPHLTIARIRTPRAARQLAQLHQEMGFDAIEFNVTELVVMQSELAAGGSRYKLISRHGFNAGVSE